MSPNQPNPSPGANATAQAKAALEEFRRRAASRAGVFGHPGITLGPSFGGPFGPEAPPFPFPGQPMAPPDPAQPVPLPAAGTSLFQSLGTMLRLSVDLLNSGLQGFISSTGSHGGGGGSSCGCNCGCEESCCSQYAAPHGCGCGCGCNPSVRNCP